MVRTRMVKVLAIALAIGVVWASALQAQERERSGRGRGPGFGSRSSLLGLLGMEQVQKEMKLTPEQTTKVNEIVEKLRGEMREQFGALRDIEDRSERMAKMSALGDEIDGKVREQLRDVLEREQVMRLYQIRMQVRPTLESLTNQFVARRLELTDDQKSKLEEINKDLQAKQRELYGKMREATDEQRSEVFGKMRELRSEADEKALGVLTDAQKKSFEEMKGEKVELPSRRGRRNTT